MVIEIANKIIIHNPDEEIREWVRNTFVITNPEYITRVKLNKWLGGTPKYLRGYAEAGNKIRLPYGTLKDVLYYVRDHYDINTDITLCTNFNKDTEVDWGDSCDIIPRPYQKAAVDHMLGKKFGILKAPCSSGKTVMGHLIAKGTGQRTLWLTHTKDLLQQSMAVGELMLGRDKVGTITNGKVNVGKVITYATIQTIANLSVDDYKDLFGCVIADEAHHVNTKMQYSRFSRVLNTIPAMYKYGLSATPETFDGYAQTVIWNLGNIEYEIPKEELEGADLIMPVQIQPVATNWRYPTRAFRANGTLDFFEAERWMYRDERRNQLIVDLIGDKPTIVLSKSIEHLCYIINCLPEDKWKDTCLVSTKHDDSMLNADINCKHTNKAREEYIQKMRDGKLKYMFSTYALAKEGLNIPCLEQVILAFPPVDPNIITQSIGRVARVSEGKEQAVCYDLVDQPRYFKALYRDRLKLYKKQGYDVL